MIHVRLTIAAMLFSIATPLAAAAQPADEYTLGPQGSVVGFTIFAKMLFTVKKDGQFKDFTGQVSYDPARPADTHVDLTVYTASVDMHNPEHESMLRSGDFFDVDRFPTMRFVSTGTEVRTDGSMALTGDLTIRGVTKHIAVPVKMRNTMFDATFQIDRTEFGLNGTPKWGGMNVSIAKNVQIHIAIATQANPRLAR